MTRPERYTARYPKHPVTFTPDQLDMIRRRTVPFMQMAETKSLGNLLAEAYLQGLRDACEVLLPAHPHEVRS
jgi:hypothetical protein